MAFYFYGIEYKVEERTGYRFWTRFTSPDKEFLIDNWELRNAVRWCLAWQIRGIKGRIILSYPYLLFGLMMPIYRISISRPSIYQQDMKPSVEEWVIRLSRIEFVHPFIYLCPLSFECISQFAPAFPPEFALLLASVVVTIGIFIFHIWIQNSKYILYIFLIKLTPKYILYGFCSLMIN